jgi:hypothetical protein
MDDEKPIAASGHVWIPLEQGKDSEQIYEG